MLGGESISDLLPKILKNNSGSRSITSPILIAIMTMTIATDSWRFTVGVLPDSSFLCYLLEVTELAGVEELKAALIDPANYTHPWKMCSLFWNRGRADLSLQLY